MSQGSTENRSSHILMVIGRSGDKKSKNSTRDTEKRTHDHDVPVMQAVFPICFL